MSVDWQARIDQREVTVGLMGLGYVGLPLAVAFAEAGFDVLGFDTDPDKVETIRSGTSPVTDLSSDRLKQQLEEDRLTVTDDMTRLADVDALNICVPTPLRKSRAPDTRFIEQAIDEITQHFQPPGMVVLRSTTYPGTTEDVMMPKFEEAGWDLGNEVLVGFSPERIDPGNSEYGFHNTPGVVGGCSSRATEAIAALYRAITEQVVTVSNPRTAEMVKLLENTFRSVNIGLANEMAVICEQLDVDVWEVIEAAGTKPYGFMAFYPGPGLGGHCIPVDPLYLSWKARLLDTNSRFIELADQINRSMPEYVCDKLVDGLNRHRQCVNGTRVCLFGVAYKADVGDTRESPAVEVVSRLRDRQADLIYCDPHVDAFTVEDEPVKKVTVEELRNADVEAGVILTDHAAFDWPALLEGVPFVVDTRNALGPDVDVDDTDVVRL